jgi:hypothetical protein
MSGSVPLCTRKGEHKWSGDKAEVIVDLLSLSFLPGVDTR